MREKDEREIVPPLLYYSGTEFIPFLQEFVNEAGRLGFYPKDMMQKLLDKKRNMIISKNWSIILYFTVLINIIGIITWIILLK